MQCRGSWVRQIPHHNYYYNRSIGGRLLRRPVYGTMGERYRQVCIKFRLKRGNEVSMII